MEYKKIEEFPENLKNKNKKKKYKRIQEMKNIEDESEE